MEKGETMKVRLIAETQETLTLLQRDSHALKSALHNAGIQTDSSSLSFDLSSGNQSFNELLGGSQQGNQSSRNAHFIRNAEGSIIGEDQIQLTETKMNFIPDVSTGNIHYSLLV
jgi:flagellar hook-length control protein FliK